MSQDMSSKTPSSEPTGSNPPSGPAGHGGHSNHGSHGDHSGSTHAPSRGRGVAVAVGTVVVLGGALMLGLVPRMKLQPELARAAEEEKNAAPLVTVLQPTTSPRTAKLDLPGNIEGFEQTAINARAAGYVQRWMVDIGDHVKAGQTLAYISAPDADQQTAQAAAQVANSSAGVQQSQANVLMMQANADQARATLARSVASWQQAKTQLVQAQAAVAQAKQQSAQQGAQVKQAQANLDLAKVTTDRYNYLVDQGAVAKQTADQQAAAYKTNQANVEALQSSKQASEANIAEANANVRSAEANVKAYAEGIKASQSALDAAVANVHAAQANVGASKATLNANDANYRRNTVLQQFQTVTAPFDGIITARNVDVGSLVSTTGVPTGSSASSTNSTTSGASTTGGLFSMVRSDRVRAFIDLPQMFVGSVQPGQTVNVSIQELGSKAFTGRIVRNTEVLDPATRTLSTEIQMDNPGGVLRPGMFSTVHMTLPQPTRAFRIPDSALVTDSNGTQVIVVSQDKKLHFQPVTVGTDYGKEMDITSGLKGGETLVSNPNPSLQEGMTVQTTEAPKLPAKGSGGGKSGKG